MDGARPPDRSSTDNRNEQFEYFSRSSRENRSHIVKIVGSKRKWVSRARKTIAMCGPVVLPISGVRAAYGHVAYALRSARSCERSFDWRTLKTTAKCCCRYCLFYWLYSSLFFVWIVISCLLLLTNVAAAIFISRSQFKLRHWTTCQWIHALLCICQGRIVVTWHCRERLRQFNFTTPV